jgi:hypothetical protein
VNAQVRANIINIGEPLIKRQKQKVTGKVSKILAFRTSSDFLIVDNFPETSYLSFEARVVHARNECQAFYASSGEVMDPNDIDDSSGSLVFLPSLPLGVSDERRREVRCQTDIPLRLTSGSGETIPAVIHNLSASGLFAAADRRFSLLLPPPNGAQFNGEFFFDDVEARDLLLEIVRVEKQDHYLIGLGCQFVSPPAAFTSSIRAKVASCLASGRKP